MSSSDSPAERLAFHVKWRRGNLALTQLEVAEGGGPSNTKLTEIENGRLEALTNATARKLDKGLQWKPGSALGVWRDGTRPVELDANVGASTQDGGYVTAPGERVDGGVDDGEVLRAIRAMQEDIQRMSERLAKLEKPGS